MPSIPIAVSSPTSVRSETEKPSSVPFDDEGRRRAESDPAVDPRTLLHLDPVAKRLDALREWLEASAARDLELHSRFGERREKLADLSEGYFLERDRRFEGEGGVKRHAGGRDLVSVVEPAAKRAVSPSESMANRASREDLSPKGRMHETKLGLAREALAFRGRRSGRRGFRLEGQRR